MPEILIGPDNLSDERLGQLRFIATEWPALGEALDEIDRLKRIIHDAAQNEAKLGDEVASRNQRIEILEARLAKFAIHGSRLPWADSVPLIGDPSQEAHGRITVGDLRQALDGKDMVTEIDHLRAELATMRKALESVDGILREIAFKVPNCTELWGGTRVAKLEDLFEMKDLAAKARESLNETLSSGTGKAQAEEIERLRAELAEARKDTERLDRMEKDLHTTSWRNVGVLYARGKVDSASTKPDGKFFFATLREALDAARNKEASK